MYADIDKQTLKQLNRVNRRREMKYRDRNRENEAEHTSRGRRSYHEVRGYDREALAGG